jgi:tetratricopeptide (TPR) repeat protein
MATTHDTDKHDEVCTSPPGSRTSPNLAEQSYRTLTSTPARVFRLLSLAQGPDVSTSAAAVLADLSTGRARRTLAAIAEADLVVAVPGTKRRWQMNDHARRLAERLLAAHADTDERERARDRLLDHYVRTTEAADDQVRGRPRAAGPERFTSRASARAWLDAERASLMAAVHMAASAGRDHAAMSLPLLMAQYLAWRRQFDDLLTVTTVSLDAARRLGDRGGEGDALSNLGIALHGLRRSGEAVTALQEAAAIFHETDDREGQGDALSNLGIALHGLGRSGEAVTALQEAAAIFRETGSCQGEAKAANNLGLALRGLCRFGEAIAAHQEAAAIYRKVHDWHGEGNALGNLGVALAQSGQPVQAIGALRDAAAVFGETDDPYRQGAAMNNLARVLRDAGRCGEAAAAYHEAASLFRRAGDRQRELKALADLAEAGASNPG